jgi:predicted CoA-binding protein
MKTVAIVGASADRTKFGNKAVRAHVRQGWRVFPVNPRGGEIEGLRVYRTLAEIPVSVDRISLYVPPPAAMQLIPQIAALKPAELFVNPGAESDELVEAARARGLNPLLACSIVAIGERPD